MVVYEMIRTILSIIGIIGAIPTLIDSISILWANRNLQGNELLKESCYAHGERSMFAIALNIALLLSAGASISLIPPEGATALTMVRIGAIMFISFIAAMFPWREQARRRRLRMLDH